MWKVCTPDSQGSVHGVPGQGCAGEGGQWVCPDLALATLGLEQVHALRDPKHPGFLLSSLSESSVTPGPSQDFGIGTQELNRACLFHGMPLGEPSEQLR